MQEKCREETGVRVVYFYFEFSDNTKQSFLNLLKSIIFQLASVTETMSEPTLELYEKYHGLQEATTDELFGVLLSELACASKTFN